MMSILSPAAASRPESRIASAAYTQQLRTYQLTTSMNLSAKRPSDRQKIVYFFATPYFFAGICF